MNVKSLPVRIAPAVLSVFVCTVFLCAACAVNEAPCEISSLGGIEKPGKSPGKNENQGTPAAVSKEASASKAVDVNLERIAEIERDGAYFPGLALAESGIRENAGDYAGAAIAAFKELSWAYGYGSAGKGQVEEGLQNALTLFDTVSPALDPQRGAGAVALRGCMAFVREDWVEAERLLSSVLSSEEEPDSFLRWMLLVCALEKGDKAQADRSAYGAIRARYKLFPEYWYRGARVFSAERMARREEAGDRNIAAAYAEQCINASPQGPFAGYCRQILRSHLGLAPNEKNVQGDVRTKTEIENIIRASVSMNDPKILEELFPLMALPDNPYTLYALGAMKSLSAVPEFRTFFIDGAVRSSGRLGERLNYISRG